MNAVIEKAKKTLDGWANLFTGFGIAGRDPKVSTGIKRTNFLTEIDCITLYEVDGFGRRVIDLPVREMTRKGFEVEGDPDGSIVKFYYKRKFDKAIRKMLRWAKVYGGAVVYLLINDGQDADKPLNENNILSIEDFKVYQRWRVDVTTGVNTDPKSKMFGKTEFFKISPLNGGQITVHYSRILMIDGIDLPDDERQRNNGWGLSIYEASHEHIKRLSVIYEMVESIIDEFETSTLSIENLQDMIASGQEALVKTRLDLLDMSKHVINTRLLDAREKFEKKSSTVTGIPDLMAKFASALSAVTGIPVTLLMGESPAGLAATGASDIRFWYDNVAAEQEEILGDPIQRLIYLIMLSKDGPTGGKVLEDWQIEFLPLWQLTETETATVRKSVAETDQIYINAGVLSAEEVAACRFGGGEYSMQTIIDIENRGAADINKTKETGLDEENTKVE